MSTQYNNSDLSRLSYTSKDYMSIFEDLVAAIPSLTKTWTSREETDPGIVLIKLMSMLGDMLSYNLDKQALEVYPETVQQRKDAAQIFSLIGYKMHWYRSATCDITVSAIDSLIIPRYTTFATADGKITYTCTEEIAVPASDPYTFTATQGTPRCPQKNDNDTRNAYWHTEYDYNVPSTLIIDDKYFFDETNIDESSIVLVDDTDSEWILVDDLDVQTSTGRFFEFRTDEYERPYIQLVNYWQRLGITQFKLFYIVSLGSQGSISANLLTKVTSEVRSGSTGDYVPANNVSVSNTPSTLGYDPETPEEARIESAKYVNTYDTLVTLDDFTRAVKRIDGVANCIALDCTNDPDESIENYVVDIYIVREDSYADGNKEDFIEVVKTDLQPYKMMPLDIKVKIDEDGVNFYYWTVEGRVFLNEPVTLDIAQDLIVKINTQLRYSYSVTQVDFNEDIKYIDVINTIMGCDSRIVYVDLAPIKYYQEILESEDNAYLQEVDSSVITGSASETIPMIPEDASDPSAALTYSFTLKNLPIKPGSVTIRISGGNNILRDNWNGEITSYDQSLQRNGTIDYKTGEVSFSLNNPSTTDLVVSYTKNVISMTKYMNLNTLSFIVADESIKSGG